MTFNLLSEANINILEEPFTLEELKDVIWNYDSEKSQGPDVFNMVFYKKMLGDC